MSVSDQFVGRFVVPLLALGVAYLTYVGALDNVDPMSADSPVTVVSPQPIPRNGMLVITYVIHVERACSGNGQRIFTDAGNQVYPAIPFEFVDGQLSNGAKIKPGEDLTETVHVLLALQIASSVAPLVEPLAAMGINALIAALEKKKAMGVTHLAPGELEQLALESSCNLQAVHTCLSAAHVQLTK